MLSQTEESKVLKIYQSSGLSTFDNRVSNTLELFQDLPQTVPGVEMFTKEANVKSWNKSKKSDNYFMTLFTTFIGNIPQTLLLLTFLTVIITITILIIMFAVFKSKTKHSEDLELLVEEENFRANSSYKFNLPVPRLPSKVFCLNFRKILEEDHYFALNT